MTRSRIGFSVLLIIGWPGWAFALPESVDVLPPDPSESDFISLGTTLEWPTTGYWVTGSSVAFPAAFEVVVDIAVSAPAPWEDVAQVFTSEYAMTDIGLLPAGTYSYTVNEIDVRREAGLEVAGSLPGEFTVVPEPSSLSLLLLGLIGMAVRHSSIRHRYAAANR